MTFEPAFRMAERELLSSLIDSENEFDAVQRRLLELSELFPLTFWKNLTWTIFQLETFTRYRNRIEFF